MQHDAQSSVPLIAKAVQASLFLLALTPLALYRPFFHYPVSTKAFFFLAVAEVAIFFLVLLFASHHGWRPRRGSVSVAFFLFILILVVTTLLGVDPSASFWSTPGRMTGLLLYLHLAILYVAIIAVLRDKRAWKAFFAVHVLVGLVVALLHFFPQLAGEVLVQEANNGSTLGNSSVLGTYLLFLIAISVILATWPTTKRRTRWLWTVSAGVFLLTLFSTDAQATQASIVVGTILWVALFSMRRTSRKWKHAGRVLAALLVMASVTVAILVFVPRSPVHETFVELGDPTRFVIWDIALKGILERPFLGWGPENFSAVFLRHYNPCLNSPACGPGSWADRAHNIVLDTAVSSGVLGLLAYIGVFVATIVALWRRRVLSLAEDAITVTLISLLVAYFVQNLTGFDSLVSLWMWIVVLAFSYWWTLPQAVVGIMPSKRHLLPMILTGLWLPLAIFTFVVQPAIGFLGPAMSQKSTDIEERLFWYDRAVNLSPAGRNYRRSFMAFNTSAALWYATPQALGSSASAAQRELAIAQTALRDTLERTSNDLRAQLTLARLYQVESRLWRPEALEDARKTLERAVELNPRNPQPLWALTAVLLEQGDREGAITTVSLAFDLNPDHEQAHIARAAAAAFAGENDLLQQFTYESSTRFPDLAAKLQPILTADPVVQRLQLLAVFY